jgi:hypothetical protein
MLRFASAVLVLSLTACGGGGGGSTTVTSTGPACEHEAKIQIGEYAAVNSNFLFGTTATGTSCVNLQNLNNNTVSSEWTFNYAAPDVTNNPVTWTTIIYGDKGSVKTNTKLPKLLNLITSIPINYKISASTPTGGGSVFFDVNLSKIPNPTGLQPSQGTTVNIDIALNTWGDRLTNPSLWYWDKSNLNLPIVTIDGVQYYFQVDGTYDPNSKLPISFTRLDFKGSLNRNETINIKSFLDYLVLNNIIPNNLYVSVIELGAEIQDGVGDIKIESYNLSVN